MFKYRHKFNAVRTVNDGISFSSKREASFYDNLKILKVAGEVLFFLRQVPFHLPGNVTYRLDFMIFYANGDIRMVDVKGFKTKEYIMKKKMVEVEYPIKIEEV